MFDAQYKNEPIHISILLQCEVNCMCEMSNNGIRTTVINVIVLLQVTETIFKNIPAQNRHFH